VVAHRAFVPVVIALGVTACKAERAPAGGSAPSAEERSGEEVEMRTYTMEYFPRSELPEVTVTAEVPTTWTETVAGRDTVELAVPGKTGSPLAITALGIDGPDVRARLEAAMALQYGAAMSDVTRTPLDDDRVWAVREDESIVHARMFIPAPHGVVMAIAIVRREEVALLEGIAAVFRTVRVQAAP